MSNTIHTRLPSAQEARQARESGARLNTLLTDEGGAPLYLSAGKSETELTLPVPAVRILLEGLEELAKGNGVTLTPLRKELTTQQAAALLGVSRPYLIEELLESGKIPYRKVGNRRRIRVDDLVRYREAQDTERARREQVMQELVAETERLSLYK